MIYSFRDKILSIQYFKEKIKLIVFLIGLILILFFARYLFGLAYSRYEVRAKIYSNIDKALYIFEDEKLTFNLESTGIIPRDDPYIYKFSVSNYNSSKDSDVDISYKVSIRTTTNLPLQLKLYRNELYNSETSVNLLNGASSMQDEDGAWYKIYQVSDDFEFLYTSRTTDIFTLVVVFPSGYSENPIYADYIENIEITLDSKITSIFSI